MSLDDVNTKIFINYLDEKIKRLSTIQDKIKKAEEFNIINDQLDIYLECKGIFQSLFKLRGVK